MSSFASPHTLALIAKGAGFIGIFAFLSFAVGFATALRNSRLPLSEQRASAVGTAFWILFPVKRCFLFIACLSAVVAITYTATTRVRQQLAEDVRKLPADVVVLVDGHPVATREAFIAMLQQIAPAAAHHSHPMRAITIAVRGRGTDILLSFGRDSERPQEYWVFDPRDELVRMNEIGRVTTSLLDAY